VQALSMITTEMQETIMKNPYATYWNGI